MLHITTHVWTAHLGSNLIKIFFFRKQEKYDMAVLDVEYTELRGQTGAVQQQLNM